MSAPPESRLMTVRQLQSELWRCEYCEERPCEAACPANCSPFDFIMAARVGLESDYRRSVGEILRNNPLGSVCGQVCPDKFCMAACSRKNFDGAIDIPRVQASIIARARANGGTPAFQKAPLNGKKVAVIGSGPAGIAAAATLGQYGYTVEIFEARPELGGMLRLIPSARLDRQAIEADIEFALGLGAITVRTGMAVEDPARLLQQGFDAVCVAAGLWEPIALRVDNEASAIKMVDLLSNPVNFQFHGRVAVIGGGATALDCAVVAKAQGATGVELFMLEKFSEMPLTARERQELVEHDVELNPRIRITRIEVQGDSKALHTARVELPEGLPFKPTNVEDVPDSAAVHRGFDAVIVAIGMRAKSRPPKVKGIFPAGDLSNGPGTVVEAVASGKNAAAEIHAWLMRQPPLQFRKDTKSVVNLGGYAGTPIPLETQFFERRLRSPYLLSASPLTDGFEQVERAYQCGWAGVIMKTAFDNVPIHIPAEYMFQFGASTYANADNVSGHPLDRVCREIGQLVKTWPDRLTMASTGGPVSGDDANDKAGWQSNTKKLESAGAMGIEYSLSCPQGGDGTEGDIVSQNAALTAKIVEWVMECGSPSIPKLFKLTAAVTSVVPILRAIRDVFSRYPDKRAGVTLANSFPTLAFRPLAPGDRWEKGVVVGMSGEGVTPISYLSLAQAVPEGIEISGNAGPMTYKAAMDFLALGVRTVQFCSIATKYGYGIIRELESGTSHLMQARGISSVEELIGIAQPKPIIDFMQLSPVKGISAFDETRCVGCGNCARCPYLAIALDDHGFPQADPAKCIGCSICALKCFAGAITIRARSADELALLSEN